MFKRIIKETKLSMKRNPVKIVLSALIVLISTTIIFSGVLLHREVNTALKNMDEYSRRHANLEYIDSSSIPKNIITLGDGTPVLGGEESFIYEYTQGGSSRPIFESYVLYDEDRDVDLDHYNIENLKLYPNSLTKELMYGDEYVYFTFAYNLDSKTGELDDEEITLKEGKFPKEGEELNVTISDKFAKQNELKINDEIEITVTDKLTMNSKVIGIYTSSNPNIGDNVIFADPSVYWKEFEGLVNLNSALVLSADNKFDFLSIEEAESGIANANKALLQNEETSNMHLVNRLEENKPFMNSLKIMQLAIYVVILLTIVLAVYLLKKIMQKDIKQYQEDRFNSVFEEDRALVRKSNCLQMVIIVIISIVISIFSSPAINEIFVKPVMASASEKEYDGYHLTAEELMEDINGSFGDPMMTNFVPYDLYSMVAMDFKPDALYTTVTVVLVGALGTVAVILGNRPPKKEKE